MIGTASVTIRDLIVHCKHHLSSLNWPAEEIDVVVASVLQEILDMNLTSLALNLDTIVSDANIHHIKLCMDRLLTGEPLAYIIGKKYFFGYEFIVTKDTLIPRGDSECLVEAVSQYLISNSVRSNLQILDLGCGSGCLGLSILKYCSDNNISDDLCVTLVDIDSETLEVAKRNAENLGILSLCKFYNMDFTAAGFADVLGGKYDIVISNPPYISRDELSMLDRSLNFEPFKALYGGKDGLHFYRTIAKLVDNNLCNREALLAVEICSQQRRAVQDIFASCKKLSLMSVIRDLSQRDRALFFFFRSQAVSLC